MSNFINLPTLKNPMVLDQEEWDSKTWYNFCLVFIGNKISPSSIETIIITKEKGIEYFLKEPSFFETVEELMDEDPKKIVIEINTDGIYVFSNEELRRELDLKKPGSVLNNKRYLIDKLRELI